MSKSKTNRKYLPYADDIPYLKKDKNLFFNAGQINTDKQGSSNNIFDIGNLGSISYSAKSNSPLQNLVSLQQAKINNGPVNQSLLIVSNLLNLKANPIVDNTNNLINNWNSFSNALIASNEKSIKPTGSPTTYKEGVGANNLTDKETLEISEMSATKKSDGTIEQALKYTSDLANTAVNSITTNTPNTVTSGATTAVTNAGNTVSGLTNAAANTANLESLVIAQQAANLASPTTGVLTNAAPLPTNALGSALSFANAGIGGAATAAEAAALSNVGSTVAAANTAGTAGLNAMNGVTSITLSAINSQLTNAGLLGFNAADLLPSAVSGGSSLLTSLGNAGIMMGASLAGGIGKSAIQNGYSNSIGDTGFNYGDAIATGANIAGGVLASTGVAIPLAAAITLAGNLVGGVIDRGFGMKTDSEKLSNALTGNLLLRNMRFTANNLDDASLEDLSVMAINNPYKNGWFNHKGDRANQALLDTRNELLSYVSRGNENQRLNLLQDLSDLLERNWIGAYGGKMGDNNNDDTIEFDINEGDELDLTLEQLDELKNKYNIEYEVV